MILELKRFSHEGNHEGLRDRLLLPYRQRIVAVGPPPESFFDNQMSVDLPHGLQHPLVLYAAPQELLGHHPLSGDSVVCHVEADLLSIVPTPASSRASHGNSQRRSSLRAVGLVRSR